MHKIYLLYGDRSIRAFDQREYEKIKPTDISELEFWTLKDGLKYIKEIEKSSDEDYRILTYPEFDEVVEAIIAGQTTGRIFGR